MLILRYCALAASLSIYSARAAGLAVSLLRFALCATDRAFAAFFVCVAIVGLRCVLFLGAQLTLSTHRRAVGSQLSMLVEMIG